MVRLRTYGVMIIQYEQPNLLFDRRKIWYGLVSMSGVARILPMALQTTKYQPNLITIEVRNSAEKPSYDFFTPKIKCTQICTVDLMPGKNATYITQYVKIVNIVW